jgi:hypothetical protein
VRRSVTRFVFGRSRQHSCLDSIGHLVALASGVTGEQPRQALSGKALAPAIDVAVAAFELGANLSLGEPIGQEQDQTGMSSRISSSVSRIGSPLQFHTFAIGQYHHALRRRT